LAIGKHWQQQVQTRRSKIRDPDVCRHINKRKKWKNYGRKRSNEKNARRDPQTEGSVGRFDDGSKVIEEANKEYKTDLKKSFGSDASDSTEKSSP
jgi:hypothetical protein